jgi:predicted Rossmann fold flavoprotein
MAALFVAEAGARTTLLEATSDGGRKILISGGGRCNILPAHVDESRFVTDSSPHALRRMLRSWPLREQIPFFENELGLTLVEETESGKLFPESNRARDVRDELFSLAKRKGVRLLTNARVTGLRPKSGATGAWRLELSGHDALEVDAVIVAAGGLSIPKTGSDGFGLGLARRLGHLVHPTYAALTPLLAQPAPFGELAGVSLEVSLSARSESREADATGGFLFTHRGYSGPAVLDVSHVAVRTVEEGGPPAKVTVRWSASDEQAWDAALRPAGARTVLAALREEVPARLATALAGAAGIEASRPLAQLRREERRRLALTLTRFELPWTSHAGYAAAEVTGGGVDLSEIDARSMQSKRHPGLYFCGEVLDAFGPIGGYNFLWAWATGRAAGLGAASVTSP